MTDDNKELSAEELMALYRQIDGGNQEGDPPSPPPPEVPPPQAPPQAPQVQTPKEKPPSPRPPSPGKGPGDNMEQKVERLLAMRNQSTSTIVSNIVVVFFGVLAGSVYNDSYPQTIASAYNIRDFFIKVSLFCFLVRIIDVFLFPYKSYLSVATLLILIGGMLSFSLGWSFSL